MKVAVASDHAGYCQKDHIINYLRSLDAEVTDYGPDSDQRVDYPDYADKVARAVASGEADCGVLLCGTGLGMALTADKVAGIRAVAVQTPEFARLSRQHNDANVVCLSGRFVEPAVNELIVKEFLETDFSGGRHAVRVQKIMDEDKR